MSDPPVHDGAIPVFTFERSRCSRSSGAGTKRPRLDWATALQRTFGIDVWTCHCGGRRTVRAIVTHRATAEVMLRNMGLAGAPTPQPASHSPPQLSLSM